MALRDDDDGEAPLLDGLAEDASHLERSPIGEIVTVRGTSEDAAALIRRALLRARERGWGVSIAGARHTMGGHTIALRGLVLDMLGANRMAFDGNRIRLGAGARWRDVIRALDGRNQAIEVMQSNADFSVGGSLGANCHGWQPGRAPIASTVESFRMVLATGELVRCSRDENAELFAHAIGGYGLFGVMIDVTLRTIPNVVCVSRRRLVTLDELADAFRADVRSAPELAFARLAVVAGKRRFEEALVTAYHATGEAPHRMTRSQEPPRDDVARVVFRGEVGSDFGKELRWLIERSFGSEGGEKATRNQLMLEPLARFANRRRDMTDVLFEAFVSPDAFASFVRETRRVIERHRGDLLNATVRHVLTDRDTKLRYAPREVLGLVLLLAQPRTNAGDARTKRMTRALVDVCEHFGARYYLPYRPHASREQFERIYPEAVRFAEVKRRHDPEVRFRNRFWDRYLA